MAKLTMPAEAAKALAVRERVLLFCAASGTDWLHGGVTGETVTAVVVSHAVGLCQAFSECVRTAEQDSILPGVGLRAVIFGA
jgi:hypothetical protein